MDTLADRIQWVITHSPHNQKELAKLVGVSAQAVTAWKKGDAKNLKLEYLYRLADVTGYSARWIAIGDGPRHTAKDDIGPLSAAEIAIIKDYRDMMQKRR